jgi:hypothetical protein
VKTLWTKNLPKFSVQETSFSDGRDVDRFFAGAVEVVAPAGKVEAEVFLRPEAVLKSKKEFKLTIPGASVIKLFTAVSYNFS